MKCAYFLRVFAAGLSALGCGAARMDAVGLPTNGLGAGMVAHWALDDGAGTVASDKSGNGHDGQVTGATWIPDGRFAGGLRLAAGDAVTVPSFPAATPNWTLSTWLRLSAEQLALDRDMWVSILSVENYSSGGWQLNIDNRRSQPRFDFAYWVPPLSAYSFTECEGVTAGRWIHLAVVVDVESGHVTLYLDGVVGAQETRPSDIPSGDSTLYIGRWNMSGRFLSGDLDDITIWSRALTADEVAILSAESPVSRVFQPDADGLVKTGNGWSQSEGRTWRDDPPQ